MVVVAAEDSLNKSMETAVKHYSSLFKLPSYRKVVLVLALICVVGGWLSTVTFFPLLESLIKGLFLGVSFFCATLIVDYVVNLVVLRQDPIYDLRRITALSLYCWISWLLFIIVGAVAANLTVDPIWSVRLYLLGFSATLILRLIVFWATSYASRRRLLLASFLQPFSCVIPFLAVLAATSILRTSSVALFLVFSSAFSLLSSYSLILLVNRMGEKMLGIASLSLFKAFLLNWILGLNAPFEELLERLGEKRDVEVSLIKFDSQKPKAVLAVPSVHPGPFKNIGSSLLPSMLKTALEKKLGCIACVPHGLLGHEFDLPSQIQNQKVIDSVIELANFEVSEAKATPFTKVSNELATACCQVFGRVALLSFTLAPKTTEDLPQELGLFVRQEAERLGLDCCLVVNAHNSIDGKIDIQEFLGALKTVATTCLEKVVSLKQLPFQVGVATVNPKDFGISEGMGPGGITVFIVKVGEQKTAYVVIDGNNMVSRLREKILSALHFMEISDGEVFTTDTHSVNAVILSDRGYHPIGEVINHEVLIAYIKEATSTAMSGLEHVKTACRNITVPDIKVIGEKLLEQLCLLIDKTAKKAKRFAIPIFTFDGLLLMLILMFS